MGHNKFDYYWLTYLTENTSDDDRCQTIWHTNNSLEPLA